MTEVTKDLTQFDSTYHNVDTIIHNIFIIHWRGPFSLETLDLHDQIGLYLAFGKSYRQRKERFQYCGITEMRFAKRILYHHKVPFIRDPEIWIGKVFFPHQITRRDLIAAEKLITFALLPELNEKNTIRIPQPTTVVSHWHDINYQENDNPRPDLFPDVMVWNGRRWFKGNLTFWD
jgi:hypothetical protein